MSIGNIYEVLGRHPVHPFPARMAPGLALKAMANLPPDATVLDPMAGSGTVIAIARKGGHRALGFDVDPLAVLMSKVWTRTIDVDHVRQQADRVIARARRVVTQIPIRDAYPVGADDETRSFVRYWFDGYVRRQLSSLAQAISAVRNTTVRDVLWCAFSRQIIAKQAGVSLALDLSHSRPHKAFTQGPSKPFRIFERQVERVIEGCIHTRVRNRGPRASITMGDARNLPVGDGTVDLVFTSPPYLNAIDYLRCSKFSLVWMGYSIEGLRRIRSQAIGTEVGRQATPSTSAIVDRLRLRSELTPRTACILNRYVSDIVVSLAESARVLSRAGRAVYVVGENTVRGTFIPTSRVVRMAAGSHGLQLIARRVRKLPANRRYLPPPGTAGSSLDARMRREVILTFEKPAKRQRRLTA